MSNRVVVKKEMGLKHEDFFRTIPNAIGNDALKIFSSGVVLQEKDRSLEIYLSPERERKIGLLTFPVTDVTMKFDGYTVEALNSMVKRFNLKFKRGGG